MELFLYKYTLQPLTGFKGHTTQTTKQPQRLAAHTIDQPTQVDIKSNISWSPIAQPWWIHLFTAANQTDAILSVSVRSCALVIVFGRWIGSQTLTWKLCQPQSHVLTPRYYTTHSKCLAASLHSGTSNSVHWTSTTPHTVYNEPLPCYIQCSLNLYYTTHSVHWASSTLHTVYTTLWAVSPHNVTADSVEWVVKMFGTLEPCPLWRGLLYCVPICRVHYQRSYSIHVCSITCLQRSLHIISRVCMYICVYPKLSTATAYVCTVQCRTANQAILRN